MTQLSLSIVWGLVFFVGFILGIFNSNGDLIGDLMDLEPTKMGVSVSS